MPKSGFPDVTNVQIQEIPRMSITQQTNRQTQLKTHKKEDKAILSQNNMIKYNNIKQINGSENHLTKMDQARMKTMVDESYGDKKNKKKNLNDNVSRYIPHTANETKISGEYQFLTTGFNGF